MTCFRSLIPFIIVCIITVRIVALRNKFECAKEEALGIGDRIYTDIAM